MPCTVATCLYLFLFNCRVIPNRGSWLDFEYDVKDFLYFKIDRKKKILASTLLLALGYTKSDMANEFYERSKLNLAKIQKLKLPVIILKSLNDGVANSDLIIFCTPMSEYKNIILNINKDLTQKHIITDVGSSK